MAAVGANGGLMVNVGVNLQQFNAGMQQVEQRGQQAAANLNKVGSALTSGAAMGAGFAAATTALSGIVGVAQQAGSAIIGLNSTLEQARIGFTAFTGSAQKSNDFIKQLQQFAATTTFEFPGLLQAARQLTGMGVQAELVIPILKDVGAAVMAVGGGEEQIKGVNRALTQMMAAGKVNAQDMNQLAQAGIPAWKMLADSMGMTIGQVRKMSEEGKISAEQMLQAFHNFVQNNNLGDVATKAGQTWQAATSNIIDGLRNIGAEGLEPLFGLLRDGAVAMANFLVSDQAAQFGADLKATIQEIIDMAKPLQDAFARAFEAFKTDGITGAIGSIITDIGNFASSMGSAGFQLVSEFASGMLSGAASLITDAATAVADIISSFLIGQSPPPQGPLSAITEGGTALMEAYVQGMMGGVQQVTDVAEEVADAFGNVSKAMTLAEGAAAFKAAAGDADALKAALDDVEGVLRTVDANIQANSRSLQDMRNAAEDINDAYDAAIEPLQAQVDALKETNDLAQKQADIQSKIQMAQLKGKLQEAQGDPVRRAQLETRLDELDAAQKQLQFQEKQISLDSQSASIAAKARGEKVNDTKNDAARNALAQQRLGLEKEENGIRQELDGMVNKGVVAQTKQQIAIAQAANDQRNLNGEIADLQRQLAAAPLEAQIAELKKQQDGLLKPIQDRIKELEREGQQLREQKQDWQDIKSGIQDTLAAQRAAAAEAKKATADAAKAAKDAATNKPMDLTKIFDPEEIKAAATKVGTSWVAGIRDYLNTNGAGLVGGAIGSILGGAAFGPLGAVAGGLFGKSFMERMQQNFGTLDGFLKSVAEKIAGALKIDISGAESTGEAFGKIFDTMKERATTAMEAVRSTIAEKLQGAQDVMATVQGKWQEMFGSESAGSKAGIAAIDGINKAFQALQLLMSGDVQGAIDTLQQSFDQFGIAGSESVKQITTSFNDLKAVLEPLVPVVAGIAVAFATFRTLTVVAAGVAALAAAWTSMSATFATGGTILGGIIALLGGPVTAAIIAVSAVVGLLAAAWIGNWGDIQGVTATVVEAIKTGYAALSEFLSTTTATIWAAMQSAWETGTTAIQAVWTTVTTAIPNLLTAMWNLLTPENQAKLLELQTLMQEAWTVIQALWTTATTAITTTATAWWATLTAGFQKLWEDIQLYWNSGIEGIQKAITPAYESIQTATTTFFTTISGYWETAKTTLGNLAKQLGETIMTALTGALNAGVGMMVDTVIAGVKKALEAAKGLLAGLGGGAGGMQTMSSKVTGGSKANPEIQAILNAVAEKYKLDAKLFTAQIQHESAGFDPNVISGVRKGSSGELGLGQFMPDTLKAMLQKNNLTMQQYLGDAQVQIELAGQHMAELVTTFGDYDKALQAYNGGAGGVGSAATTKYAQIVHEVASGLQSVNTSQNITAQKMSMNVDQITAGRQAGLSMEEAQAICGPYAAVLFAQATGKTPSLSEAKELAQATGWSAAKGMGGTGNFMGLLGKMGINAVRQAATPENVNAALGAGKPVAFSTNRHYFVGSGGTAEGGINVGATGTVMSKYGGKAIMTLAEIESVGNGMNDLIVLTDKLAASGQQSFNELTASATQFGDAMATGNEGIQAGIEQTSATTSDTATAITASTQTLTQSIQGGLVPAGLAARDAVGAMAMGIQPLISTWAQGGMTSNQLAESIVQLAAQSGLATAPLAQFAAGNATVGEALRQVMGSLAAADPAFAQIQEAMGSAQVSTEQLADVLLRGLSNVTGVIGPAMSQIAVSAKPIETAFATGAISSEQFVQSVVELAATSGLTQAPLRMMQDGVLTTNQALAAVVATAAEVNPAFTDMAASITDLPEPATEAAQAFIDWSQSLADSATATTDNVQVIQDLPTAVTDIQQPMQDASTTTMQVLPDATSTALDSTISAIQNAVGPATSAATDVGNAIVEGIRSAVEAGAESIADAAVAIVEKALEAAKKAADKVKESAKKDGGDKGDDSDSKATGGRLSSGMWTLVGENGPELIDPSGYVYTAEETAGMASDALNSGLVSLQAFASGGAMKSSSKKKKTSKKKDKDSGGGSNTPPEKPPAPPKAPVSDAEYALEVSILKLTQQRDEQLVKMLPITEALRKEERAQEEAAKGTLEQQIAVGYAKHVIADVDVIIAKKRFEELKDGQTLQFQEGRLKELQEEQAIIAKGSLETQLKMNELDGIRLKNEAKIAELQLAALPAQQELANVQAKIAEIQKGSVEDQIKTANIQAQQHKNQFQINELNIAAAPLHKEEAQLQAEIQKTLEGTTEQKKQQAQYQTQLATLELASLKNQEAMLPIQHQISQVQKQIDDVARGTLEDQYAAIDATREDAKLRMEEININSQLRKINAGTLEMSQEQINALHKQLEVINDQKADIGDQNELKQLQATINNTDAQKQLAALQAQERQHQNVADDLDYQKSVIENQTGQIGAQNQVSAAGQQERLAAVQAQLTVYTAQITELQAQNDVLGLQVDNIALGNQIRADALAAQQIKLEAQVGEYNKQITAVQQQNALVSAQSALLSANNAVAAQGSQAQILGLQNSIALRQVEITHLGNERDLLQGQITLINTQTTASAAMHNENITRLENQKHLQDNILEDINAQLGSLNAQKKVYEDIRALADAIAARPVSPPGTTSPSGGPPGTVAATATKSGAQTLYLSRGTGTDGWYTSSGQLIVQGGSANPPSGYQVKWLASGGTWHAGEVAVLGENGPEIAIAKSDMHVFPNEQSQRIARAFGGGTRSGSGSGSGAAQKNVTVNVEYHRHSGTDYGEGSLPQIVREAVNVALRS